MRRFVQQCKNNETGAMYSRISKETYLKQRASRYHAYGYKERCCTKRSALKTQRNAIKPMNEFTCNASWVTGGSGQCFHFYRQEKSTSRAPLGNIRLDLLGSLCLRNLSEKIALQEYSTYLMDACTRMYQQRVPLESYIYVELQLLFSIHTFSPELCARSSGHGVPICSNQFQR